MLRTAGSTFPQAASPSSTSVRAISAALSGEGSVLKTSIASVTPAMYGRGAALSKDRALPLLEPRHRGSDGAGALEALLRHPADHLRASRGEDPEPPVHGELEEPGVQLHLDLLRRILRDDVLEEGDPEVADVRFRLVGDRPHRAWRESELEVGFVRLSRVEGGLAGQRVEAEVARDIGEPHRDRGALLQGSRGPAARLAGLEEASQQDVAGEDVAGLLRRCAVRARLLGWHAAKLGPARRSGNPEPDD